MFCAQTKIIEKQRGARERRDVGVVVGRGDFDQVHADKIDGAEATKNALCLPGGEAAHHRCAGAWRKSGIEAVDIESQVGGVISYHLEDALGNGRRAFLMNEVGIDNGVTKGFGVVCADADLGRVFGGNEALLERTIKHAAVVHS